MVSVETFFLQPFRTHRKRLVPAQRVPSRPWRKRWKGTTDAGNFRGDGLFTYCVYFEYRIAIQDCQENPHDDPSLCRKDRRTLTVR